MGSTEEGRVTAMEQCCVVRFASPHAVVIETSLKVEIEKDVASGAED